MMSNDIILEIFEDEVDIIIGDDNCDKQNNEND